MGAKESRVHTIRGTTVSKPRVLFVVGGPGCGKGTYNNQCYNLVRDYGFIHLSTGDLLREEQRRVGSAGDHIRSIIKEGRLVGSEIIVDLLSRAITSNNNPNAQYLIDGFPRNTYNVKVFNQMLSRNVEVQGVLYFDCSYRCMRGKSSARADDNAETIKKRLETFKRETLPVVIAEESMGRVIKVNAGNPKTQVYDEVQVKLQEKGIIPNRLNTPISQSYSNETLISRNVWSEAVSNEACLWCLCKGDLTSTPSRSW